MVTFLVSFGCKRYGTAHHSLVRGSTRSPAHGDCGVRMVFSALVCFYSMETLLLKKKKVRSLFFVTTGYKQQFDKTIITAKHMPGIPSSVLAKAIGQFVIYRGT